MLAGRVSAPAPARPRRLGGPLRQAAPLPFLLALVALPAVLRHAFLLTPGPRLAPAATAAATVVGRRGGRRVALKAGERVAYIAVVESQIQSGSEEQFLEASLANARESMREPSCQRFDVLQSVEDPTSFTSVEIYRKKTGPADHEATEHCKTWKGATASIMDGPSITTQWDTIFPTFASEYAPSALILERSPPTYFDVTHVFVDVLAGSEGAFIAATLENAKASTREADNLRFDVLRSVEDPTKFLLIEVYRNQGAAQHKKTEHYQTWRERVADMMASPRSAKRYRNHFPSLPAGWQGARA